MTLSSLEQLARVKRCACGCEMFTFDGVLIHIEQLAWLAHNLAIGAALCKAFEQGRTQEDLMWNAVLNRITEKTLRDKWWRPGCDIGWSELFKRLP